VPHKCPEARREYQREYRKKHTKKIAEYAREYQKNNDLSVYKANWYSKKKYRKYGITEDIFLAKLKEQEGRCAICKVEFTEDKISYIDHCHKTEKFRGVLCMNCNTGLGHFKDETITLENAIRYLTNE
jgi:hypothetical protein